MSKKKKIVLLSAMVVLLVVSGVLNFVLTDSTVLDNYDGNQTLSVFAEYRESRVSTRDEEILILDSIISDPNSSDEARANAEELKLQICKNMETELVLETQIKSKGFEDAIVTISSSSISVAVDKAEITSQEMAQILSIVVSETGKSPSIVRIAGNA